MAEDAGQQRPTPGPLRRARTWLGGTVVAGLGATIVMLVTDTASDVRERVLERPDNAPPLSVTTERRCGVALVPDTGPEIPASGMALRAVVTGRSDATVVLTGVRVVVDERLRPPAGHRNQMACAALPVRLFAVNLDPDPPSVQPLAVGGQPAVSFPLTIDGSEPEAFEMLVETETCFCRWHAELAWASGARNGVVRIDDHGAPFRTTAG
ncbi:MAG TPA: hypothetical protein VF519_11770 [Mycobacteriales bacterium]|jgi:hypothetical protein